MIDIIKSCMNIQFIKDFFTFLPYCCDADQYLQLGKHCARYGQCYSGLRPQGALYWFSIPYRFNISPQAFFISAHLILAAISILLSVIVLSGRPGTNDAHESRQKSTTYLLAVSSILVHAFFLMPTIRVPLTDTPANILVLIGLWIILLKTTRKPVQLLLFAIAGLCFGLAAWMRVFFLYPILVSLILVFVFCLFNKNRSIAYIGLLTFLIPTGLQLESTYKITGSISFLGQASTKNLINEHATNNAIGYDTVNGAAWKWYSACPNYKSLNQALSTADLYSIRCLLLGRINFYLGSYNSINYIALNDSSNDDTINLLSAPRLTENSTDWSANNLGYEKLHANEPFWEENYFWRLRMINTETSGEIYQTLLLKASDIPYVFSLWTGTDGTSPGPATNIIIRNHLNKKIISQTTINPSPEIRASMLYATIPTDGEYDIVLQLLPGDSSGNHDGYNTGINIWRSMELRHPEPFVENANQSRIRLWSPLLFIANFFVFSCCFLVVIRRVKQHSNNLAGIAWLLVALIFGQALVSLPEQRFIITPMIFAWMICLSVVIHSIDKLRYLPTKKTSHD